VRCAGEVKALIYGKCKSSDYNLNKKTKMMRMRRLKKYSGLRPAKVVEFPRLLRKWLLVSIILGFFVGLAVTAITFVIYDILWNRFYVNYQSYGFFIILLPIFGFLVTGLIMRYLTRDPSVHGTNEVIESFHKNTGEIGTASSISKSIAAITTIGFGGCAGMEGPSIYAGGSVGAWLWKKLSRAKQHPEDRRIMLLAGAAAGISAVFKAPLTGIIFALEVPYKDGLAHEALLPSLISSVVSYITFVAFMGVEPLFLFTRVTTFTYTELLFSALLGGIMGLLAILFSVFFRKTKKFFSKVALPLRALIGGAGCGFIGILCILILHEPYSMGPPYAAIKSVLAGSLPFLYLLLLTIFLILAVTLTLGSVGVGGIFIPIIAIGASLGGLFSKAFSLSSIDLFVAVGMASFLAACYKTPLASVAFAAETTGSPFYLIPSLIASAISDGVSGDFSISENQILREEIPVEELMDVKVRDIMMKDVITVPSNMSLAMFIDEFLFKHRHRSFPVVDKDELFGMVSVDDIANIPTKDLKLMKVADVAKKDIVTADPDETVGSIMDKMYSHDIGRIPVVDAKNPKKIVGIVSKTDIIRGEEMKRITRLE
jgi:CIC family chloride channel protein